MMNNYPEGVSLIICTYNGAKRLPDTISHINRVVSDPAIPWEFIVVDNASDDGSGQVALELWQRDEPMRVIVETEKGLIHARYRGIREAKYEYISFIDDDNWIDPDWINNIFKIFKNHPEVGICGSRNTGIYEVPPPEWHRKVKGAYAIGNQGEQSGDVTDQRGHLWGAGMSMRKSAFEHLIQAGFKSILTGRKGKSLAAGEDTELAYAFRLASWRLWYSEELNLKHFIPSSRLDWDYVIRMYIGFGKSHAMFDIYKLVLKDKPYRPGRFYKRLFKAFWKFYREKLTGSFKNTPGNVDYLKYISHRAKLLEAIGNFHRNNTLYQEMKDFKNKVREDHQI
jgi:glycosyltransferase involved in cell wall biosynthesis